MLTPYEAMATMLAKVALLHIQQTQKVILIPLLCYLCPSDECEECDEVSCLFRGKYLSFSLLSYFHQILSNFVCLLFGAEQLVYSGIFTALSLKTSACFSWKRDYESRESEPKQQSCKLQLKQWAEGRWRVFVSPWLRAAPFTLRRHFILCRHKMLIEGALRKLWKRYGCSLHQVQDWVVTGSIWQISSVVSALLFYEQQQRAKHKGSCLTK